MKIRAVAILLQVALLVSCADMPVKSTLLFQLSERDHLYDKAEWSFVGRIAVSDENNSMTATIDWRHQQRQDEIELAGPFGQGRTQILITDGIVMVDYGDEQMQYFAGADDLLSKQLGVTVPVSALRYWVLGLVEPEAEYISFENGFLQAGWNVSYQQMQIVGEDALPRKIKVQQGRTRLKLIINHWDK